MSWLFRPGVTKVRPEVIFSGPWTHFEGSYKMALWPICIFYNLKIRFSISFLVNLFIFVHIKEMVYSCFDPSQGCENIKLSVLSGYNYHAWILMLQIPLPFFPYWYSQRWKLPNTNIMLKNQSYCEFKFDWKFSFRFISLKKTFCFFLK